jgi:hypothetical protein
MKNLYLAAICALIFTASFAQKITAVSNGNWTSSSTWDLHRQPANGDTVIIPSGKVVTVSSNANSNDFLYIKIFGELHFAGGQLSLDINSSVFVFISGKITSTGSPSEKIRVGNVEKYRGSDPNVLGPMEADQNSGSGFLPFGAAITLPVKFIGFNIAQQNNAVLIQWATAQETNSNFFEIQRSENGNDWITITTINAAGNSNSVRNYSYSDRGVNSPVAYYRIKEIDIDGRFVVTPVRVIKFGNSNNEIKMNNSSANSIYVHFSQQVKGKVTISLTNLSGQSISANTVNNPIGQILLPVQTNVKGIYIVTVTDGQSLKVSKQILL